jgi:Ca-activated chloride channel family protein
MKRTQLSLAIALATVLAACAGPVATPDPAQPRSTAPPAHPVAPPAPPPPPSMMVMEQAAGADSLGRRRVENAAVQPAPVAGVDRENYQRPDDNPVRRTADDPVSTFAVDVDTGSYSNVRRLLRAGQLPPADAVRAEEFINYFDYGYQVPAAGATPFAVHTELARAPWNRNRHLLMIGLQGHAVAREEIPAVNIVYLVDSSGSMQSPDKLELLRQGFALMTAQLRPQDQVAIVAYAGSAGLVLPATPGSDRTAILAALDRLTAGGSTNGGAGIELAYAVAREHFIEGGVNRVVLASDGDFNVGTTGVEALTTLVADRRRSGIGLTVLGFGGGNYNDHLAEQLANTGNGTYHYIDTVQEARKVLVDQLASTVLTIAQDVKVQVEFNPAVVQEWRLVGYENRLLAREDFNNDRVDAGEIGAGHSVTALYELALVGSGGAASDPLRYAAAAHAGPTGRELGVLRLRHQRPGGSASRLVEHPIGLDGVDSPGSERLRFAAAVAGFADALRGGGHIGPWGWPELAGLAQGARGADADGYRGEFLELVGLASQLATPALAGRLDIAD